MGLFEEIEPKCSFQDLVLPEEIQKAIHDILEDHEFYMDLMEHGLIPRKRILLHGPPGCGKTSIAHAFARKMKIRLYAASLAQTIGSLIGDSEKHIESIIKYSQLNKVVMLVDEFDSLATNRLGGADSGSELSHNRTVNSILTNLEAKPPQGLLIACTNMFDSLDSAVVRRFDVTLKIPEASRKSLKVIADKIIQGRFDIDTEAIVDECATPAAVVRMATDRLRAAVIERAKENSRRSKKENLAQLELLKQDLDKRSKEINGEI